MVDGEREWLDQKVKKTGGSRERETKRCFDLERRIPNTASKKHKEKAKEGTSENRHGTVQEIHSSLASSRV
jgi:hypothetical protein